MGYLDARLQSINCHLVALVKQGIATQHKLEAIMVELDDLKTSFAALKDAVGIAVSDIGALKAQAEDLAAKLAAALGSSIDPAAVEAIAQDAKSLSDGLTAAHASLAAAPPAA